MQSEIEYLVESFMQDAAQCLKEGRFDEAADIMVFAEELEMSQYHIDKHSEGSKVQERKRAGS
jgi:hypothetical protein